MSKKTKVVDSKNKSKKPCFSFFKSVINSICKFARAVGLGCYKLYKNPKAQISFCIVLFFRFLVSSFLYIKKYSLIFPVLNTIILLLNLVLFRQKYRIYALFLYMPFIIFFNYKPLGIGSFYSYVIIIYCAIVILETLFSNKTIRKENLIRLMAIGILSVYSILLSLVFSGLNGLIKSISIFAYMLSIALFVIDSRSFKNKSFLILIILIGTVVANLLACLIIYVLKGEYVDSFLKNFLAPVYYKKYHDNNDSFRYPGLSSDPNYLGMNILLLTIIAVINFKQFRFKVAIIILLIISQIFPILGASRNYFVCLVGFAILFAFVVVKKKNGWLISLGIFSVMVLILFIFGNSLLSKVILRIISVDGRESLLDTLLSGRATLQMGYLSDYLLHPTSFIIGRGFVGSLLEGDSAHSIYVMSFRYFGLLGTLIYYFYISTFVNFRVCKTHKILITPIILLLIYGFTIDYISYSEMTLFLIFIYSQSFEGLSSNYNILKRESNENYTISI